MPMTDLLVRLSYDCPWRGEARNEASNEQCEAHFPDMGVEPRRTCRLADAIAIGQGR